MLLKNIVKTGENKMESNIIFVDFEQKRRTDEYNWRWWIVPKDDELSLFNEVDIPF